MAGLKVSEKLYLDGYALPHYDISMGAHRVRYQNRDFEIPQYLYTKYLTYTRVREYDGEIPVIPYHVIKEFDI